MSQYKTGTVSVTSGSSVVTGSGTAWQTAGIDSSNIFTKEGDNVAYTIASVDSDTQITLTANYSGSTSSGSAYGVTIDFTPNGLPLLSSGDLNTDAIYNEAMLNIDNNVAFNDDLGAAAYADITNGTFTPVFSESHNGAVIDASAEVNNAKYKLFNNTVTCRVLVEFNDSATSVSVGDVFTVTGFPASLRPAVSIGAGSILLRKSLSNGNYATFETLVSSGAPETLWFTCTAAVGVTDYGDTISGTIEWIID